MKKNHELENNQPNGENIIADGERHTRKKNKKWPWVLFASGTSLLLILAVVFVVGFFILRSFDYNYNKITSKPGDLGFEEVIEEKTTNIALFGVDTKDKDSFSGRSDSIMILSINNKDKTIRLVSVMRDTLTPIVKNGRTTYNKINNAYASGGPELAIKTLNSIFALDISEYATVNFSGMESIIDAVGGIDVPLTTAEIKYLRLKDEEGNLLKAGVIHLDGKKAVTYSRIRSVSNAEGTSDDYGRTDRQRLVLQKLFTKAVSMNKSQYVTLIKGLMPCCETSLSYVEILDLAAGVLLNSPSFEESRIPATNYLMKAPSAGVGSVVYYDLNYAANIIHAYFYEGVAPEDFVKKYGVEKYDWYGAGYYPPEIISIKDRDEAISKQQSEASQQVDMQEN